MPTINFFIAQFGWPEFWISLAIIAVIVGVREKHHFTKKKHKDVSGLSSKE